MKWENRIKDTLDKEKKNDNNGSIQMSEDKWRSIMKKVDSVIDTYQDNIKEQKQEDKKQLEEKIGSQKILLILVLYRIKPPFNFLI